MWAALIAVSPDLVEDEGRKLIFIHAGVSPEHFPACVVATACMVPSERFLTLNEGF